MLEAKILPSRSKLMNTKKIDKLIEYISKMYVQDQHSKNGYGKILDELKEIKKELINI